MVLKRDFGTEEGLAGMVVDPLDRAHLVLTSLRGSIINMYLTNPIKDRVDQQQYRVDCSDAKGGPSVLVCVLSATRDILYILLPRQARGSSIPCADDMLHLPSTATSC